MTYYLLIPISVVGAVGIYALVSTLIDRSIFDRDEE